MNQLNRQSIRRAAIVAVALLSALNLSPVAYAAVESFAPQDAINDALPERWYQAVLTDDILNDYDRIALETKLILHGHVPMRNRTGNQLCNFPSRHLTTKQEQIMDTYAQAIAASATVVHQSILDMTLASTRGQ